MITPNATDEMKKKASLVSPRSTTGSTLLDFQIRNMRYWLRLVPRKHYGDLLENPARSNNTNNNSDSS